MNKEILKHIENRIEACDNLILDAKIAKGELKVVKELIENESN